MTFARHNGIDIKFGNPNEEDRPGVNLVLPSDPGLIQVENVDLTHLRHSYIKKAMKKINSLEDLDEADLIYMAEETKTDVDFVKETLKTLGY